MGFSYIGISHQCHTNHPSAVLPLGRLLFVNLSQRSFNNDIRFKMIRRSISSCVSPDREVPRNLYLHRHWSHHPGVPSGSTNVADGEHVLYTAPAPPAFFALAVWARMAKISRIRDVRSSILILSSASILRICLAESSSSKSPCRFRVRLLLHSGYTL